MADTILFPVLLAIAAALSSSSAAAQSSNDLRQPMRAIQQPEQVVVRDVVDFTVAGVRLGMTPEQARAALAAARFQVTYEGQDAMTYRFALDHALTRRYPAHRHAARIGRVRYFTVRGPAGERVSINFIDTETGNFVSNIAMSFVRAGRNSAQITQDVMRQYGRPTVARDSLGSAFWCSRAERRCDRVGFMHPMLEYSTIAGPTLRLTNEHGMRAAVDASIEAAVANYVPGQPATVAPLTALPSALRAAAIAASGSRTGQIAGARIGTSDYYVLYIRTPGLCGSGGCRAQIWQMTPGGPAQRGALSVGSLPIVALAAIDNGLPRLGVTVFDNRGTSVVAARFGGREYGPADWDNPLPVNSGQPLITPGMLRPF